LIVLCLQPQGELRHGQNHQEQELADRFNNNFRQWAVLPADFNKGIRKSCQQMRARFVL